MIARRTVLASLASIVAWQEARGVDAKEGIGAAHDEPRETTPGLRNLQPHQLRARDLSAPPRVLDFEGVVDASPVGGYYGGAGGGPDYGVVFGSAAFGLVDFDAGGSGNFANEPSPSTVLRFLNSGADAFVSVRDGFTGLSFWYASGVDAALDVYDGPNGTGTVLANGTIPRTPVCAFAGIPQCGDPTGTYGKWVPFDVSFLGVAKSVRFRGEIADSTLFDDVTITPAPQPCTKTTYWLWDSTTNTEVGELLNNSASCIAVPYNIEVRPCTAPPKLPVRISLQNATNKVGVKTQNEYYAPYFLWGDTTATGDVFPNKKPLPKGAYFLNSNIGGKVEKITFTKTC